MSTVMTPIPDPTWRAPEQELLDAELGRWPVAPPVRAGLQTELDRIVLLHVADVVGRAARSCGSAAGADDVAAALHVAGRHRWVIDHWYGLLVEAGLAGDADPTTTATTLRVPVPRRADLLWAQKRIPTLVRDSGDEPALARYLLNGVQSLRDLLTGDVDPREHLFPGGSRAVADAVYRNSPVARSLNTVVGGVVARLCATSTDIGTGTDRGVHVLELGAGTGGTTGAALDALATAGIQVAQYQFTDLGATFLADAHREFGDRVSTDVLDLDDEQSRAAVTTASVNVVVAANAAHNCTDVREVSRWWQRIVRPGGGIVLLETVREPGQSQAGMPFLLSGPHGPPTRTDSRAGSTRTYLTADEWSAALRTAGFEVGPVVPDPEHPSAAAGQHVLSARRP